MAAVNLPPCNSGMSPVSMAWPGSKKGNGLSLVVVILISALLHLLAWQGRAGIGACRAQDDGVASRMVHAA